SSVDLPTLGRPTIETKPERKPGGPSAGDLLKPRLVGYASHEHRHDASPLHLLHAEAESVEHDLVPRLRNTAEHHRDQPADGLPLFVIGKIRADVLVQLPDRRLALHQPAVA